MVVCGPLSSISVCTDGKHFGVLRYSTPLSIRRDTKFLICRQMSATVYTGSSPVVFRISHLDCRKQVDISCCASGEDFISRVLRENPSQVEPKYLIGNRLYTQREKELVNKGKSGVFFHFLKRLLGKYTSNEAKSHRISKGPESTDTIYLKDILREFKGQLYVPEQTFMTNLSEEEEFDRILKVLPKMNLNDFMKMVEHDMVKLLTSKSEAETYFNGIYLNFIVDLKEIPGQKSLQRTKWAMTLNLDQASILSQYRGPRYEIETHTMSHTGERLMDCPHPVAASVSSRVMVELGMLTALLVAAASVVGGFLASAVFVVTSFLFIIAVYIIWPITKHVLRFSTGVIVSILEIIRDSFATLLVLCLNLLSIIEGLYAIIDVFKPVLLVAVIMVVLIRYTLSRRPKDFILWDIWQGIEFSQSKPQARVNGSTGVTFSDVAGIDEAVEELQELVKYLKNPELFAKMGIKPPHGVLLEGPPGCGKTLVAKAIAGEAGVPFYQMAGSEFVEILVGVGSARIRDLFMRARVNKPSVVFIDEVDALGAQRGVSSKFSDSFHIAAIQEKETTLNQLLIELDGFDTGQGVIFIGSTNRMDLLDPALLRPGRFDRKIRIYPPRAKGRLDILRVHARKVKLSSSVDLSIYAQNLTGWTGAKLAQLLQEAALAAVRNGHKEILQSDMDNAVDLLIVGPKRIGIQVGHEGQCRRATTEAGTAITSHLLRRYENAKVEPCVRISINPRGQTLSQIVFRRLDDECYIFERRPQLLHRLQVLLGGRVAEEVMYGENTSSASASYLADASLLAYKILTIWNLEDPMTIHGESFPLKKEIHLVGPRLDFEGSLYDDYGLIQPSINLDMDDDVAQRSQKLITDMYKKTFELLKQHSAALIKTIQVLLSEKEIRGDQIEFILDHYPAGTPINILLQERCQ